MVLLRTPTAAIKLAFTPAPPTSGIAGVADFVVSPQRRTALVAGPDRLAQNIRLHFTTPVLSHFYTPSDGNSVYTLLGRPLTKTDQQAAARAMVEQAESSFIQRQAQAAAQGYLTLDQQVDALELTQVSQPQAGQVSLDVTATTATGTRLTATAPFGVAGAVTTPGR